MKADEFARYLADVAKPYETWLTVMRFGMGTLLKDQELLLTLLCARVALMQELDSTVVNSDKHLKKILDDLGLRFEQIQELAGKLQI